MLAPVSRTVLYSVGTSSVEKKPSAKPNGSMGGIQPCASSSAQPPSWNSAGRHERVSKRLAGRALAREQAD